MGCNLLLLVWTASPGGMALWLPKPGQRASAGENRSNKRAAARVARSTLKNLDFSIPSEAPV